MKIFNHKLFLWKINFPIIDIYYCIGSNEPAQDSGAASHCNRVLTIGSPGDCGRMTIPVGGRVAFARKAFSKAFTEEAFRHITG
jgi:hypothetical protein